ncbi:hypothetical protein [Pedobacter alluvionis]|uniref:Uncharacterized protein n=1 Tax=Pedobacter alluvionis TaxID=475253 RepID=A0A497Y4Z2_9SPHI|nr:hypothetical protein [Pedobacter alluvionis]RLJ75138.1 hypothetical protein BCL90_3487 [Pedobacter alluvionis]TFB30242.1 hypothetical protein E3V97_18915 [Pedobacter alluvionis]
MKRILLTMLVTVFTATSAFSQGKITIFNTTLKVDEIVGVDNIDHQKWNRKLKEALLEHKDFYIKTIGSYRDEYTSEQPYGLFNMIDKGSYPLLDKINMQYYDELILPNLKSDTSVKGRADFIKFCTEWDKLSGFAERKLLLFKDEFIDIGKIIQSKRISITSSSFDLAKSVTKKFDSKVTADIKANLQANNIDANANLVNYLSSAVTSQTVYKGTMLIVAFEDDYMHRLFLALNGISESEIGNDNFSKALMDFAAPGSVRAATTGLVVLKLDGKINKSRLTEESLKADLAAKFKSFDQGKIADIAAAISIGFVSKVESKFTAQIDNIYITNFLTSKLVDDIQVSSLRKKIETQLK